MRGQVYRKTFQLSKKYAMETHSSSSFFSNLYICLYWGLWLWIDQDLIDQVSKRILFEGSLAYQLPTYLYWAFDQAYQQFSPRSTIDRDED